jgi:hypothetical protein
MVHVPARLAFALFRTAVLHGGLAALQGATRSGALGARVLVQAPPLLHREALALLLGRDIAAVAQQHVDVPRVTVLDVRRYDERALYGAIPGTFHLPGECMPLLTTGAHRREASAKVHGLVLGLSLCWAWSLQAHSLMGA